MLTVEAKDLAAGDFSPDYGTITEIVKKNDVYTLKFFNGTEKAMKGDEELEVTQGGRFDRRP